MCWFGSSRICFYLSFLLFYFKIHQPIITLLIFYMEFKNDIGKVEIGYYEAQLAK